MRIGFTSTSFRQIKSVSEIVKIASLANADCIEWGGDVHVKNYSDAERVNTLCEGAEISISSYGSYYRVGSGDTGEWKRICEIAAAMNCGSVRYTTYFGSISASYSGDFAVNDITAQTEFDRYDCKFCHAERKSDSVFVDSGKNTLYLDFTLDERKQSESNNG